jgi:DNA-binding MarR family transcriptional regulator
MNPLANLLERLDRSGHSVTELRVLLALIQHRDVSTPELADLLALRPASVREATRRLANRGLIRSRYAERSERTLLTITDAGMATAEPLLSAAA